MDPQRVRQGMHKVGALARSLVALVASGAFLLAPPLTLAATSGGSLCAEPPPLEKAVFSDLVFVGFVTDVTFGGRSASVKVSDVWRGDVPATVIVDGGFNPGEAAEDARVFSPGVTYLFVPTITDGRVIDSICSPTVQWTDDLGRFRPPDAHPPSPVPSAAGPNPFAFLGGAALPVLTAGLIGGAAFLMAFLVARRRET